MPSALFRTLITALFAAVLAFAPGQAGAQGVTTVITTTTIWTDGGDSSDADAALLDDERLTYAVAVDEDAWAGTTRRYAPDASLRVPGRARAQFGPFAVVDATTVRMAGDVDAGTPRAFAAMMAAYPTLKRLVMVDCPGSLDDEANLALARAVRRTGMATIVPPGGSVRSGAVDLFLAGVTRSAAPDAEFGVHSWRDANGMEADDFAASDPVNTEYINYYREMGLDAAKARAFYALTNSTPFDEVRYLTRDDMARFVTLN